MVYSKERELIKCESCKTENATQKHLDYILCKKCMDHINNARGLYGKIKNN